MNGLFSSFWRAAAYCLHPRVILLSVLPLLVSGTAVSVLGYLYWEGSVAAVRGTLEHWSLVQSVLLWLESVGANQLRTLIAPLIVVALAVPVLVLVTLLLVALFVTSAIVRMVARRRFPALEKRQGTPWWQGLFWGVACTLGALVALVLSIPLWLIPPLVLILPPLIWGWLTYRVMAFDVLSTHAAPAERRAIMRTHGWPLLAMGIVCGYLGAAPSLLWAASAATLIFAPVLVLISVWLYTLVFVFSACWFAHFALAALQRLRAAEAPLNPVPGEQAMPPPAAPWPPAPQPAPRPEYRPAGASTGAPATPTSATPSAPGTVTPLIPIAPAPPDAGVIDIKL